MFLLIFRYVFGGAISVGGISYVDFLVPGFVTTGVLFGGHGRGDGDRRGHGAAASSTGSARSRSRGARCSRDGPSPTRRSWSGAW